MGCFIGCFRGKDSKPDLVTPTPRSDSIQSKQEQKASRSKNALSTLFQCDEDELLRKELNVKEEAEFLTASGTLPNRRVETRKASEGNSHSLVDSPSSCITDGQNTTSDIQKVSLPMDMPESEIISPDPPPLKLTIETQTPGTVSPAHTIQMEDNKIESVVLNYEEDTMSKKQFSGSLSDWLKPVSPKINRVHRKTPGDRPILGMVAAHWKDEETSHVSPTWWDGNGIPNSTNKYKEDQKVSWHATPFEERLEKALSEETFVSQRKSISQTPPLLGFSESEESDTAFSRLQPSDHIKSVVSF